MTGEAKKKVQKEVNEGQINASRRVAAGKLAKQIAKEMSNEDEGRRVAAGKLAKIAKEMSNEDEGRRLAAK